jgi:hypothetical protein
MNGNPVLVSLAMLLVFSSCDRPPEGTVERRFEMPDSLGTFWIQLDSNLTRMDSGIVHSDYKCGDLLQQQYTMRDWAQIVVSPFGAMDAKDSLFYFTWSIDLHSPPECDSALTLPEWMRSELRSRRQECTVCAPVDSGIVELNGTQWAFIQYSDKRTTPNDILICYTRTHGRGMNVSWQRLAPSAITFDFGAYARRQLETARLD